MKKLLSITICCTLVCIDVYAQANTNEASTDSVAKTVQMKEMVVGGSLVQREVDHVNCIPTAKQKKHSHSGFELIRNMMIPDLTVNTEKGVVTTPAGPAGLYINGRLASAREVKTLRPKDIVRIEYHDMPTGKYASEKAVLNYVLKESTDGGYTEVDALQGVGYLKGDYNVVSKYTFGKFSANIWAGYSIENPKEDFTSLEHFELQKPVDKNTSYAHSDCMDKRRYVNLSLTRQTPTVTWMIRPGLEYNGNREESHNASVAYNDLRFDSVGLMTNEKTTKPTLFIYYNNKMSDTKNLELIYDGYYARNTYNREYNEDMSVRSDVKEDYLYSKFNANYSINLPKQNSLTFSLHEYLRLSEDNYGGSTSSTQKLRSSETIFFVDYSKSWNRTAMMSFNPGVSYLDYKLQGLGSVRHVSPRLQAYASWMPDRVQRLMLSFSLGNTFPSLGSLNNAEQIVDRVMLRRGNPDLSNSTLYGPSFTYSLNKKKWSASFRYFYWYSSNAIVNTYSAMGERMLNTFSSDVSSHEQSATLSFVWKPNDDFNVKCKGEYNDFRCKGAVSEHLVNLHGGLEAIYYVGDFSFSGSVSSKEKSLVSEQYHCEMPWQYELSAEWSNDNWSVILQANNLFMHNNEMYRTLSADMYSLSERTYSKKDNAFASAKIIYTIDYGKKVRHSQKFSAKATESCILK